MTAESLLVVPSSEDVASILNTGKESAKEEQADTLEWYFPDLEPGRKPFGARVLVQLRRAKTKTKGGIVIVEETKQTDKWNDQVARVVALGPLAFCNRETKEPWPEGAWAKVGDYVSVPRWGGDRWEKEIPGEDEKVTFCIFNDHELISLITEDPRNVAAYIL
jgi:co-chaperonin GroES (HSP10)